MPNTPLEDNYSGGKLQPDNEIVLPQNNLYTILWEVDFEYELLEPRRQNWTDDATRLPNDTASNGVDNYVTEDAGCSIDKNEHRCNEQTNENDVTESGTTSRLTNSRDMSSLLNESPYRTENENDVTTDLENTDIASKEGADITEPGISKKENSGKNENPRGGKYIFQPNLNPIFTEEYRY